MNKHDRIIAHLNHELEILEYLKEIGVRSEETEDSWKKQEADFIYALKVLEAIEGVDHWMVTGLEEWGEETGLEGPFEIASIFQAILDAKGGGDGH